MNLPRTMQGRWITQNGIALSQQMIKKNLEWNRYCLSWELAILWNWYSDTDQLKDMACRTLLKKWLIMGLSNWQRVGLTTDRSRQDRYKRLHVSIKDIYFSPSNKHWQRELQQ